MKQSRSRLKYILPFLLLVIVFMGFAPEKAEAKTSLPRWSGAKIPNEYTTIDDKFTFIPKFTSKSSLSRSGGYWRQTRWSSNDSRKFQTFNVLESRNSSLRGSNKVIARYRNVGKYNGQEMDLRIVVKDWRLTSGHRNGGNISFEENKIAVSTTGFEWVDMEWQFYKAGSSSNSSPVRVDGYFTISDIDLYQGVDIHDVTYRNIDKLYIGSSKNQLWYDRISSWHRISTDFEGDVPDNVYNDEHAFTYTFSADRMRFKWLSYWSKRPSWGENSPGYASTGYASGEYFIYTDVKPARFKVVPKKKVNRTDIEHPNDTGKEIIYDVKFKVPKESTKTYYNDFLLTDTIDPILNLGDVSIYDDDTGANLNYRFDIRKSGNKVKVYNSSHFNSGSKKNWRLRQAHFYDTNYRMRIKATINTRELEKRYKDKGTDLYNATNTSYLTINNSQESSNRVITKIWDKPTEPDNPDYRLRVFHKDENTGRTIKSSSAIRAKGYRYNEYRKTNLKDSRGRSYKFTRGSPTNSYKQSGYMSRNTDLYFYYKVEPTRYRLKVLHIDDDTGQTLDSSSQYMDEGTRYSKSAKSNLRNSKGGLYSFSRATPSNQYTQTGNLYSNKTLRFYYKVNEHSLRIEHIDEKDGRIIDSETRIIPDGDSYTEIPKHNLKRGKYKYKHLRPSYHTGTINGSNKTIRFYYRVPKMTIKNKGIHIYTDIKGNKQPVDIFIDNPVIENSGDSMSDFKGGKVKISIAQKSNGINKTVWSRDNIKIEDFEDVLEENRSFKMPNNVLLKGRDTKYEFKVEITSLGVNDYELITENSTVKTLGYTSKEGELNNKGIDGDSYTGVVLTESDSNSYEDVDEYEEHIKINKIEPQPRLKSGYGYEFNTRVKYHIDNEDVAKRVKEKVSIDMESEPLMKFDEEIVDLPDEYIKDNKAFVSLSPNENAGVKNTHMSDIYYTLPEGHLSRVDGKIRHGNKYRNDSDYVNAGNKMYVPKWIKKLKVYDASFKSTKALGANKMTFNLGNTVDVYAFMLNHTETENQEDISSPDIETDELLLHPMDKEDELYNKFD